MHNRCPKILWTDRIRDRVGSRCIACAINCSTADAAARHETAVAEWPVFTTRVARSYLRLATKFSNPNDQGLFQHSALLQIFEKSREGHVCRRNKIVLEPIEIIAVRIPKIATIVMPIDGNQRYAMFN